MTRFNTAALAIALACLAQAPAGAAPTAIEFELDQTATGGAFWSQVGDADASPGDLELPPSTDDATSIDDAQFGTSREDAYDEFHLFAVDGRLYLSPGNTADRVDSAAGTLVTFNTVTLSGLDSRLQYFFDADAPVVRSVASFENTTGSAITATVRYGGNLGSDSLTTILATSSGDTAFTVGDRWTLTDDTGTTSSTPDPDVTTVWYGPGSPLVTPSLVNGLEGDPDSWFAEYDITVDPGETVGLMWFGAVNDDNAAAEALANATFNTNADVAAQGLLTGLSLDEQRQIVNWAIPEPSSLALLALGGLFVARRRR
ncbi:MAG: PEP-CTERM sorting domain-containing protein [Planctomycetota bacterium]